MNICLDTSAWLEYFNGGPNGPEVRKILQGGGTAFTPAVVAAQLVEAARLRQGNSHTFLRFLQSRSEVVPVDAEVARLAGKINASRAHPPGDWSMMESLILATARFRHAKLLTRDPIFADLPDAIFLGHATRGP